MKKFVVICYLLLFVNFATFFFLLLLFETQKLPAIGASRAKFANKENTTINLAAKRQSSFATKTNFASHSNFWYKH